MKKVFDNFNLESVLNNTKTKLDEFNKTTQWLNSPLNHNFLTQSSINVISSGSGVGKTYFAISYAIELLKAKAIKRVIHLNFDGNTEIFSARNQNNDIKHFYANSQWYHIRAEDLYAQGLNTQNFLREMVKSKIDLSGILFIYDSFVNFVPKLNDTDEVSKFMSILRMSSNLGAIHWINTHNKKGEDIYSGSSMILNLSDATWLLKTIKKDDRFIFIFKNIKGRHQYKNQAFELMFKSNIIKILDYDIVSQSSLRINIIEDIKTELSKYPEGLPQSKLILKLNRNKDDKTTRNIINSYMGRFWYIEQIGREKIIKLMEEW